MTGREGEREGGEGGRREGRSETKTHEARRAGGQQEARGGHTGDGTREQACAPEGPGGGGGCPLPKVQVCTMYE